MYDNKNWKHSGKRKVEMRLVFRLVYISVLTMLLAGCASSGTAVSDKGSEPTSYRENAFNSHCRDPQLAGRLRSMGPFYAIGASISHGLFATSFPVWIRDQMCLSSKEYADDYFFLFFFKSNGRILRHLSELRPKLILALDFPYHYVKLLYAEEAKPVLRKYLGMLLMDCKSELIDCSEDGPFHFVKKKGFRPPVVLAGSIYFDCRRDQGTRENERRFPSVEVCREENRKLNVYMRELQNEYSNLYVLPAYEMIMALHHTEAGTYRYDVDGVKVDFKKSDLFFDGFHPWTDPGSYVLANLVINWINKNVRFEDNENAVEIPYIPLKLKSSS